MSFEHSSKTSLIIDSLPLFPKLCSNDFLALSSSFFLPAPSVSFYLLCFFLPAPSVSFLSSLLPPLNVVPSPGSHYRLALSCFSLYIVSFDNLLWFHNCDQYFHTVQGYQIFISSSGILSQTLKLYWPETSFQDILLASQIQCTQSWSPQLFLQSTDTHTPTSL